MPGKGIPPPAEGIPLRAQKKPAQVRGLERSTGSIPEPLLWLTYEEAAMVCRRTRGRIAHLVSKHKLKRVLVYDKRRAFILLPASSVAALRRLTLGF